MKKGPKLLTFILLNIILSASTILLVMWLWDRAHPLDASPAATEGLTAAPNLQSTSPSTANDENLMQTDSSPEFLMGDYQVKILTIVGPGNLDVEYVEIRNESQGAVDISGWQLSNAKGQSYTFPAILLNNDGAVKIFSKQGVDTVIELYWQSETPIWESGETARLLDDEGNLVATYSIP